MYDYTPSFTYYGSLEGDGACFGVWIDHDALEEAIHDEEVSREPTRRGYYLEVSDHGNMTLHYNGREVWSVA